MMLIALKQWFGREKSAYHRNGYRDHSRSFLRSDQCHRGQHESDEQASRITKKNACREEVKSQKTQGCARQCDRDKCYEWVWHNQGHYKDNQGAEERRTGGQPIQTVN